MRERGKERDKMYQHINKLCKNMKNRDQNQYGIHKMKDMQEEFF